MRNLPVHWSEGLFLRPHHFQAADRYWAEVIETSERWDHQYNYGIRALGLSEDAIANHQFQVNVCHARMKDGTLVSLEAGQEPDRVDLKDAFAAESVVRVFLAVPKLKLGAANVATDAAAGKHRYGAGTRSFQDESFGGNDQEVECRTLNVRVLLSTQDTAGYELLPIAQVQRAGEEKAAPNLDGDYFPPMLAIDAWPPLGRDVVRAVYDILGKKIEVLSQQVINRGISLATQVPGDLDRLMMLSELNAGYSVLRVLAFAAGVHPFVAYTELCRLVGQLAIFGGQRRVPELPLYDHDDLAGIFRRVKELIEMLLTRIRDYEYEQRFFVGRARGMTVTLESQWFNRDWQWFIGVYRGSLSREECVELLSPGKLNWKLGSARQVEVLFERRMPGLHLTKLEQAPRALPPTGDVVYFEVARGNAAWNDVLETETLAMRINENLIANLDDLQGKQELIVSHGGKQLPLRFALFAVPEQP
jgi:type VI secretion system protein ImpJ